MTRACLCVLVLAVLLDVGASAAPAGATEPASGWAIEAVARPSAFSAADNAQCAVGGEQACDGYQVMATNVGSRTAKGPVKIVDRLAPDVQFVEASEPVAKEAMHGIEAAHDTPFACAYASGTVTCEYTGEAPVGDVLMLTVYVKAATSATEQTSDEVQIEEAGKTVARTTIANELNPLTPASFGVQDLALSPYGVDGAPDRQAGEHPYGLTTGLDLTTAMTQSGGVRGIAPVQEPRDLVLYLPLGLAGDPLAAPRCPESELAGNFGVTHCPANSEVGTVALNTGFGEERLSGPVMPARANQAELSPLYNVEPERGYPAEFGFNLLGREVLMFATVVRTPEGYALRLAVPGIPRLGELTAINGVTLSLFGDPAQRDGGSNPPAALFSNPRRCTTEAQDARIEADSWQEPHRWAPPVQATVYPRIEGCDLLQFDPALALTPETTETDTPSGYAVDLRVPQAANVWPEFATPDIKDATIALPAGISLSPGAASGLAGCKEKAPEGIEIPTGGLPPDQAGEGEDIGPDGLSRPAAGHCPAKSRIGEVEVETPLLSKPLKGHVYVAQPSCGGAGQPQCTPQSAEDGQLYGLYIEASGSGVVLKLKGTVSADPRTGRLTATFEEGPQLPFEELRLKLNGGSQVPLANPQTCGPVSATGELVPWGGPAADPVSPPFPVTGCANPMPFFPGFSAGTVTPLAGGFSPFETALTRKDGEQNLGGVSVTLPPGVAGMISKVPLCGEAQANAGTCPEASRIGTAHVAVGAGSEPLWLEGRVYLTGPYGRAPFGLSIVVPVLAGPFDLGDEVVRAAISVDPHTAQVTLASEPLRLIRDGVPFRLKAIDVTVDRPRFIFNPTNCSQLQVTGSVFGELPSGAPGSTVPVSTPFAVAGCRNLPFKPSLSALTHARHTRKNGEYLHVVVKSGAGQANIAKVHVTLPKQLPSRLATFKQACAAAQFAANPAGCPRGSFVGAATAYTSILSVPLTGPAIFVSHGGAAFPDVDLVLQGEGVTVILTGATSIKKGITTSTFAAVPDVPITRFDLILPAGPHSALAANGNLCKGKLLMGTTIAGQNGAVITRKTKIAVSGCQRRRG